MTFNRFTAASIITTAICISHASDGPTFAAERLPPEKTSKFIRILDDERGQPAAMQTAITSYRPAKGDLVVDLIAAIHLGDRSYYDALNKQFESYDALLFELVAPEGSIPDNNPGQTESIFKILQRLPGTVLGLESQLDHIDYTKPNFVHADLSPEEISKKVSERGDDVLTIVISVFNDIMKQQEALQRDLSTDDLANRTEPTDLLAMLSEPIALKRRMAEQFADTDTLEMGLGKTLGRMLIDDRNIAALRVFQTELTKGTKRIAIFYGAAHMADFERRLRNDFGLQPKGQQWLTAWNLKPGEKKLFHPALQFLQWLKLIELAE